MSMSILARRVTSRLIPAAVSELSQAAIQKAMGLPPSHTVLQFMVFEARLGPKRVYCCLAGGELSPAGEVLLTTIGRYALEALVSKLPPDSTVIMQELQLGKVPLKRKVKATIAAAPPDAGVCFFGDMAGELDGLMFDAIGLRFDQAASGEGS